jgi:hypothetical protein
MGFSCVEPHAYLNTWLLLSQRTIASIQTLPEITLSEPYHYSVRTSRGWMIESMNLPQKSNQVPGEQVQIKA